MTKKIVLKVELSCEKYKQRTMSTIAGVPGIDSVAFDFKKNEITVIGDADPVEIASKLRMFVSSELLSVAPAKGQKKDEKNNKKDDKKNISTPPPNGVGYVPPSSQQPVKPIYKDPELAVLDDFTDHGMGDLPPFRKCAQNFFLTYAQCNIPKEQLLEHLKSLPSTAQHQKISVTCEIDADGNSRLHALLQYDRRFDLRDSLFFDFQNHRPHIRSGRSAVRRYAFLRINNDFVEYCREECDDDSLASNNFHGPNHHAFSLDTVCHTPSDVGESVQTEVRLTA